jgi:hypothetical protein
MGEGVPMPKVDVPLKANRKRSHRKADTTHVNGIGTMRERSLHAALKAWYAEPGDQLETEVDGFLIDIVRDGLLIEIQTGNFSSIKRKLTALTGHHKVRLVYPIAAEKWIVRLTKSGLGRLGRRKSPKHGHLLHVFEELVSIPTLPTRPNFSLEVLLIQEEEVRRKRPRGLWRRRGWGTHDRRLLDVIDRVVLGSPADFLRLIPDGLPDPFTTADLAQALSQPRYLMQKMAYCLRKMGAVDVAGKRGNAILYGMGHRG